MFNPIFLCCNCYVAAPHILKYSYITSPASNSGSFVSYFGAKIALVLAIPGFSPRKHSQKLFATMAKPTKRSRQQARAAVKLAAARRNRNNTAAAADLPPATPPPAPRPAATPLPVPRPAATPPPAAGAPVAAAAASLAVRPSTAPSRSRKRSRPHSASAASVPTGDATVP